MRAAAWTAAALAASAVFMGGCGADDNASTSGAGGPELELSIRADDGAGKVTSGKLICRRSEQQATGDLAGGRPAAERCRDAASLTALLQEEPGRRVCTKLYGGPQTVHVTGTIDGSEIDKRVDRTDGCEIADYARLKPLLPG